MKSTWKCIKSINDLKHLLKFSKKSFSNNSNALSDPYEIAESFNDYFASIADMAKENKKSSHKYYSNHLRNKRSNSIFVQP